MAAFFDKVMTTLEQQLGASPSGRFLLGCVVLLIIGNALVTKFRRHLYAIPGPPLAGFTGLWKFWDVMQGSSHETGAFCCFDDLAIHNADTTIVQCWLFTPSTDHSFV